MSAIEQVHNYIGGRFEDGGRLDFIDVLNPSDGSVISRVPISQGADVDRAVAAARAAFPKWSAKPWLMPRRSPPISWRHGRAGMAWRAF